MKKYSIIRLNNDSEYTNLVIICNANSPFDYMTMIKEDLMKFDTNGKILIDQILHVGNTNKRFISMVYDKNNLEIDKELEFVNISKGSLIRKISCNYLKDNGLVEFSILTSIQKRMINKGISI
ncbi:type II toxin-antitoxin system RnlB family antitoxin [Clostridium tertium]|uniref:type II toxin-antitoxin system RnlB family antitoxin n=1 Tax=Clostridium tertium TaxID=1559 RepID=UPI0018A087BE|nr:type II toxin-antitoxin system RnlB family antitoxin [Clostridium tertium]MDB1949203.1 type II toxin-antitoxin system RnlB family antitoxin [Clostridium tertium]